MELLRLVIKVKHHICFRLSQFSQFISWKFWLVVFSLLNSLWKCRYQLANKTDFKRMLVIHTMRVGDTVVITPIFEALKRGFPNASIDFVTSKIGREVAKYNPNIRDIYIFDQMMSSGDYFNLLRVLRKNMYDVVLDLNNGYAGLRRELLALASNIPKRIAFRRKGYRALLPTDEVEYPLVHAVDTFLILVRPLGIYEYKKKYEIFLSQEEKSWVREKFAEWQVSKPVVILNPGTLEICKQWSAERFSWVADELVRQRKVSILITAGVEEKILASVVKETMRERSFSLAGQTTLREYFALIAASDLVLSVDTAAVHIAVAFDTPLVALFHPIAYKFYKPESNRSRIIYKSLGCESCFKIIPEGQTILKMRCTKEKVECMLAITKEEVLEACLEMLNQ